MLIDLISFLSNYVIRKMIGFCLLFTNVYCQEVLYNENISFFFMELQAFNRNSTAFLDHIHKYVSIFNILVKKDQLFKGMMHHT